MNETLEASLVQVERRGSIAFLTLNRPRKLNALNLELNRSLIAATLELDSTISTVILQGAGNHFCAGSDLHDLYQVDRKQAEKVIRLEMEACHVLAQLPQLTISVLHGKCIGGGAILPFYTDLRIASLQTEISMPEAQLGWIPPYGIERLQRELRGSLVFDLVLGGKKLSGGEALQEGVVSSLFQNDEERLALLARLTQVKSKILFDTLRSFSNKQIDEMKAADERSLSLFLDHFSTDASQKTISAFVEKLNRKK